jgi:hypothetical protein
MMSRIAKKMEEMTSEMMTACQKYRHPQQVALTPQPTHYMHLHPVPISRTAPSMAVIDETDATGIALHSSKQESFKLTFQCAESFTHIWDTQHHLDSCTLAAKKQQRRYMVCIVQVGFMENTSLACSFYVADEYSSLCVGSCSIDGRTRKFTGIWD